MWTNSILLPFLLPIVGALALLFFPRKSLRPKIAFSICVINLSVGIGLLWRTSQSGVFTATMGGWNAPFGITLAVDTLSALMILLAALVHLVIVAYLLLEDTHDHVLLLPLMNILMAGINLCFLAGDFFNLFVSYELILMASYAMLCLNITAASLRQAWAYLTINIVGGTLFFMAAGLCYALFGTLNFADITLVSFQWAKDPRFTLFCGLTLLIFALKAGAWPLFYWLPRAYKTLSAPLAALFSALLTKVGVYCILRVFGGVLPMQAIAFHLLWGLAVLTMGILMIMAVQAKTLRDVLSFNLVAHVGVILLAISLATPMGFVAAVFYSIHHILVIASLFLLSGLIRHAVQSDHLAKLGGFWKSHPLVSALFFVQSLSLASVPPFSGFWAKLMVIFADLGMALTGGPLARLGAWGALPILLLVSLFTLWSLLRVIVGGFWPSPLHPDGLRPIPKRLTGLAAGLVAVSLIVGFFPQPWIRLSETAIDQLLNIGQYGDAVLMGGR